MKSTNDPNVTRNDAKMRKRALECWENEGGKFLANSQKSGDSITAAPSNDLVHGESNERHSIQKS